MKARRLLHMLIGHDVEQSETIETHRFTKHPQNEPDSVYAVSLMRCPCGLFWLDEGFELRATNLITLARHINRRILRAYDE